MEKAATGIYGLDGMMAGGLPRGRTTLVMGGPGCGKTVLGLQSLVHAARHHNEPGIFVAFEESSRSIVANAATFGWDLEDSNLFFLDAQPAIDQVYAGDFDLQGMLAILEEKIRQVSARRVVFDSIDVLLNLMADPKQERSEVHRLHHWLLERELTAVMTAKVQNGSNQDLGCYNYMQFMVDCVLLLKQDIVGGVSQRYLRVLKYRGSSFSENDSPLVITEHGMEVAGGSALGNVHEASTERVSTGVERLDTMLNGGYHRGASILISGAPGTAKSTLCGAFVAAACQRGERALFVSFDSGAGEIARNLRSVGMDLAAHVNSGLLRIEGARAMVGSAEMHFMHIRAAAREQQVRCLVVDPLSALSKGGNLETGFNVVERLIDWCKSEGITVVCTSLLAGATPETEGTPMQVSTIADTWIHLSYLVHAGERNRALTIIKSRGTSHSNQVREMILNETGITLADVYTAGGQVLMGTLRWREESAQLQAQQQLRDESERKRLEIELSRAELERQMATLQKELELRNTDLARLRHDELQRESAVVREQEDMLKLREGDGA